MAKNNNYKKLYSEDKFAREFYYQHARENQLRQDKKAEKKKVRNNDKKLIADWRNGVYDDEY